MGKQSSERRFRNRWAATKPGQRRENQPGTGRRQRGKQPRAWLSAHQRKAIQDSKIGRRE